MNKNLIYIFLLFIFFVILFHFVNYIYFTNKENMGSMPTEIPTNAIAQYINANAKELTTIIQQLDPNVISNLIKETTTALKKVNNVQPTPI